MTAAIIGRVAMQIAPSMAKMATDKLGMDAEQAGKWAGRAAGLGMLATMVPHAKKAGEEAGLAVDEGFGEGLNAGQKANAAMRQVAQQSGNAFEGLGGKLAAEFMDNFNTVLSGKQPDLSQVIRPFQEMEEAISAPIMAVVGKIPLIGGAVESMKSAFDTGVASATGFAEALISVGDQYIEFTKIIGESTVDTDNLDNMGMAVRDILSEGNIVHAKDIVESIGRLDSNLKNLSTNQLKELTTSFAQAEEIVGEIDPTAFAGVMNAWELGAEDADEALTTLVNTQRLTGEGINQLMNEMMQVGPSMRAFGYSAEETNQFFAEMVRGGEPARRAVFMWSQALKEAGKTGMNPEDWLRQTIGAVKEYIASGDLQSAMTLVEESFGQRGAPLILEDIRKGFLDVSGAMPKMAGINADYKETLAVTQTLEDTFENIGQQMQAVLAPMGAAITAGLVDAGAKVTEWFTTHQPELIGYVDAVVQAILTATADIVGFTGHALVMVSDFINPLKEIVLGFFISILDVGEEILNLLGKLPDFMGGDQFDAMRRPLIDAKDAMRDIADIDMSKAARDLGSGMINLAEHDIPGAKDKLHGMTTELQATMEIQRAMTAEINGELGPAFDQLKDKSGMLMKGTAEDPKIKLLGDAATWATVRQNLHAIGIDIENDTGGVISKISFANKEAQEQWKKFYEDWSREGEPVNVKTLAVDENGKIVGGVDDLVGESEGIEVKVLPSGVVAGPGGVPTPQFMSPGAAPGAVPITPGAGGTWTSSNPAWAHLIQRESGGNPTIPQGDIGDINNQTGDLALGLFQITTATWTSNGGLEFAPNAAAATPQQQAIVAGRIFAARGGQPWGAGLSGRENEAELRAGLQGGAVPIMPAGGATTTTPFVPGAPGSYSTPTAPVPVTVTNPVPAAPVPTTSTPLPVAPVPTSTPLPVAPVPSTTTTPTYTPASPGPGNFPQGPPGMPTLPGVPGPALPTAPAAAPEPEAPPPTPSLTPPPTPAATPPQDVARYDYRDLIGSKWVPHKGWVREDGSVAQPKENATPPIPAPPPPPKPPLELPKPAWMPGGEGGLDIFGQLENLPPRPPEKPTTAFEMHPDATYGVNKPVQQWREGLDQWGSNVVTNIKDLNDAAGDASDRVAASLGHGLADMYNRASQSGTVPTTIPVNKPVQEWREGMDKWGADQVKGAVEINRAAKNAMNQAASKIGTELKEWFMPETKPENQIIPDSGDRAHPNRATTPQQQKESLDALQWMLTHPNSKQEGGGVPWLAGTTRGKDGVFSMLAPDEHVWTTEEVDAAGGHSVVEALRKAALAGTLKPRGLQGGGAALDTHGAQIDTIAMGYAVLQAFGISNQGFYRGPDGYDEHSGGVAVDVMMPGGVDDPTGYQVNQFALNNASAYGVNYTIWANKLWYPDGTSKDYGSTGNATDQHRDHVHINTQGGGYPAGTGPGEKGAGSPSSNMSSTPSAAAQQLLASGSLPQASSYGGGATGGGGVGASGPSMPGMFNPFDPSQTTGMSQRDIMEAQAKQMKWQQGKIDADQAVVSTTQALSKAQTDQAAASAEAAAATKAYTDLLAKTEGKPQARAAAEAELTDLANKAQVAHDKSVTADQKLADANNDLADSKNKQAIAGLEPSPEKPGGTELTPDQKSEALGKGLVKGVFQELGFPDVFGKPFTEWGAYKLAMGGLGYGAGLLQNMTQLGPGNPIPGATPGGAPGGGGGSGALGFLTGLGGGLNIPGEPSQVASQPFAMPGSEAPANVPLGAQPQNHLTVVNNNSGIMAPPVAQQTIADAAHTTAAPQLHGGGGLPGPG